HRDDADARVRTAVLRFVGAVGLGAEAAWVASRLAAREAAEADAAMRALEQLGRDAVDVTWQTLCTGSMRARTPGLTAVRTRPDGLAHWWAAVRREIDRGLALLVIAGTLEPNATPSIVVRRLRERMDHHALAALFLLAALLDDARLVRAGELLARAP